MFTVVFYHSVVHKDQNTNSVTVYLLSTFLVSV